MFLPAKGLWGGRPGGDATARPGGSHRGTLTLRSIPLQRDRPHHPHASLCPGTPTPGPAAGWVGLEQCQAGGRRRAAQSCGWHFMLMAQPLFIPLEFITIALFGIGSFSVTNASIGFFYCDLINNE